MIEGMKVVSAQEMARVEGEGREQWMEEAGRKVAALAMSYIGAHGLPKKVILLVGKGNNGGDAYAAGIALLEEGYQVRAFPLRGKESPLNRTFKERFLKQRGKIESTLVLDEGIIVDGLLGTGFKGKLDEETAAVIRQANGSGLPILAIDIPSGLDGSTGEVESVAIGAQETVALGLPKMGFFLRQGWNHVGKLHVADFGLPPEAVAAAEALAYLPKRVPLPKLIRNRHKYEAGYVVGLGGSKALSGAVKLAGLAALRAGAGIVRLFSPEEIGPAPLELICNRWSPKSWKEALEKAQAVFVGPGLGRSKGSELKTVRQPSVIDADALVPNGFFPKGAILTPHRGEVLRLLGLKAAPREEELFAKVIRFCEQKEVLVVLKGAPTFIFRPKSKPIVIPRGDPGMATAGAGDVLTGVIAALLAQRCSAEEAAILGVTLHALAGEAAAQEKTSYCLMASDLIEFMPNAFQALMKGHDIV